MSKKIGSRISITITPEQRAGLEQITSITGVAAAHIVRSAINKFIVDVESVLTLHYSRPVDARLAAALGLTKTEAETISSKVLIARVNADPNFVKC